MPLLPSQTTVQAVLFDYGLVLTGPPYPPAWERMKQILEAPEAPFHAAYWRWRHEYDLGALSAGSYWHRIAADLERQLDEKSLGGLIHADTELWTQPNPAMIAWAASLQAAGVRTGILSNLGDAMEAGVLERCSWMRRFDHITFSHRLGVAKPDPAIYRHAAEGLGVPPGQILFIDDREDNIAGARLAGMQAIRYIDQQTFDDEMQSTGFQGLRTAANKV